MIKKTKIGNTEVGVQATYHYTHHRMFGINFTRIHTPFRGMTAPMLLPPSPIYYTLSINLWKYVFKIGVTKYNDE